MRIVGARRMLCVLAVLCFAAIFFGLKSVMDAEPSGNSPAVNSVAPVGISPTYTRAARVREYQDESIRSESRDGARASNKSEPAFGTTNEPVAAAVHPKGYELKQFRLEVIALPREEKDWGDVERWSASLRPTLIVNIPRLSVMLFVDSEHAEFFYVARPSKHGGDVPIPSPYYALQTPAGDSIGIATEQGSVDYVYFSKAGEEAVEVASANEVQLDRLDTAARRETPPAARIDTPGGEITWWSIESHCGNHRGVVMRQDGRAVAETQAALCFTNPFSEWKEFVVIECAGE